MNAGLFGYPLLRDCRQARRLERAFKALGVRPSRRKAAGIEGLSTEFTEAIGSVGPGLGDVVTLNVAARVEHYEIAAHEGLIEMSRALGEREVQERAAPE